MHYRVAKHFSRAVFDEHEASEEHKSSPGHGTRKGSEGRSAPTLDQWNHKLNEQTQSVIWHNMYFGGGLVRDGISLTWAAELEDDMDSEVEDFSFW